MQTGWPRRPGGASRSSTKDKRLESSVAEHRAPRILERLSDRIRNHVPDERLSRSTRADQTGRTRRNACSGRLTRDLFCCEERRPWRAGLAPYLAQAPFDCRGAAPAFRRVGRLVSDSETSMSSFTLRSNSGTVASGYETPDALAKTNVTLLAAGAALASWPVLASAFVLQYLGLLAERWFFFAQAKHPQNLYYQAIS